MSSAGASAQPPAIAGYRTEEAPGVAHRMRWRLWAPLLIYALLTLVMTWPLAKVFISAIPGDAFDGWQNFWNLWWMRIALIERTQQPFQTDLLFAPTGVSLLFHTLNPFNGLLTMPLQLAAGGTARGLYLAYNSVVLFSFTLSGYGAFLLARWVLRPKVGLRRNRAGQIHEAACWWAALVAGAIFTFAPFHFAHLLGHMQVFAYQWVPFFALCLLRADEVAQARSDDRRAWLRPALLAGLFFVLMALCDWYFALYGLLFGAGAFGWRAGVLLVRGEARRAGRLLAAYATAGALAILLLLPLLAPMVREAARDDYMVRPSADLYTYSASALDFVIPNRLHTLFRPASLDWPGNQVAPVSERTLAVGTVTLLLAVAGLILDRKRAGGWVVAALLFGALALGPLPTFGNITAETIPADAPLNELSLYNIVNTLVPFMRISRSVARFALMVQLSLAVAAAVGLAALLARLPSTRQKALAGGAVLLLLLAEFWVAPFPMSPPDTPPWYTSAAAAPADPTRPALLNLPMNYDRPGYLLYQTEHGRPLTVAYISRDDPRTLTERVPLLQHLRHLRPDIITADLAAVGPTILADLGVGTVVLDRYKMPEGAERAYTEAVAAEVFDGVAPQYEDERITVYAAPDV
ncbi:MAG: hypothetical protein ACRC1H_05220, partial [Caldilineaceae bacterium]